MRRRRTSNLTATLVGAGLMLFALANSLVTVASGDYSVILLTGLICALLAFYCLAVPIARGPLGWRIAGFCIAMPGVLVIVDFIGRAPHVYGSG